jgi:hypothetical protein
MMEHQSKYFFRCDCGCTLLLCDLDWQIGDEIGDFGPEICLSIYKPDSWDNLGWKERIRRIWQLLRYGLDTDDSFIMSYKDVIRLKECLEEYIEKHKAHPSVKDGA